jgi:pimeloyl-ACP methyl ester carboxylesterase/membrane protein DedA with SNARE-associated domain
MASLRAVDGERLLRDPVRVVFREHGPADAPVVVLLHGSPGSKDDFATVAPELNRRFRVIVPDLPGFGESTREIPDYSIRAHANYLDQLMLRLGVDRFHVVGFSMGGGVAIELARRLPEELLSLTLLSAIGVQELELFGNYRLNHMIHGAQLTLLWLVREGLPHFGLLDNVMLGVPYARNFYDSDQRPLREILRGLEAPLLVLHGDRDFLVTPETALENHRIVAQSELQMLDRSHFMVFLDGPAMARRIADFIQRVEDGDALNRADALPDRVRAASAPFDPATVPPYSGVALTLILLLIVVATLISEDLTCIGAGLLAAQGRIDFLPAVAACFVGIFVGDLLLYLAGRYVGRPALEHPPFKWLVRPEQLELSAQWFSRRGGAVILLSRFVPGARLPTYFAAGLLHTSFFAFILYFFVAVALWTPLLVGAAMLLGERTFEYLEAFQRNALPTLILLAIAGLVLLKLVLPLATFAGRRGLVAKWRRAVRWEFWPPWLFYPPVVVYVLLLGLKHRNPLLFTAANPAIEAGGFIAESKSEILAGLAPAGERVARWCLIPSDVDPRARLARLHEFMKREGLALPVVLKPDAGQRGSGVSIIRSLERLRCYVTRAEFDVLVQEYAPGEEFGVFYYRYPGQPRGRIFSITEKKIPEVVGDAHHTVEQLILRDARAVCLAAHYLQAQAHQLDRVPHEGETIPLVELGTHCRGAIFLDGSRFETAELAQAIDEISRKYNGFYFGRYDLRVQDVNELALGRGFKILELNGVTSEATHIYDPRLGLRDAYRTLFRQWRVAFEIGHQNRERGHQPAGLGELLRLVRAYRESSRTHAEVPLFIEDS